MLANIVNRAVVALVALTAGAISASHIIELGQEAYGPGHGWQAALAPVPVDGALLIASLALASARRAGRPAGATVWVTLVTGVIGSIAANLASAPPTLTARLLAVSAPIALALAVEILLAGNGPKKAAETAEEPRTAIPEGEDTRGPQRTAESVKPQPTPKAVRPTAEAREARDREIAEAYAVRGIVPNRARVRTDHKVGAGRADRIIRMTRGMAEAPRQAA